MNSNSNPTNYLDELLEKCAKDDSEIYTLATNYMYFAASSNIGLINQYKDQVLEVLDKWKESLLIASPLIHMVNGYSYFFLTQPEKGIKEFEMMLSLCGETDLFRRIKGLGYTGSAVCNRSLGKFDRTMEDCLSAISQITPSDPPELWQGYAYRTLGEIHTYINELDEAIHYYLKAKVVMDTFSGSMSISAHFRVLDALGNCYREKGDTNKAENYLKAADSIDGISKAERARVLCDFGILNIGNPQKALEYFEESCEIRKQANLEDAYTTSLIYKGECLIELGKFEEAKSVLFEAKALVDQYKVPSKQLHLYHQLAILHENMNDYEKANSFFHIYDKLKTQIGEEQTRNIFHIKNKQIADQHAEIQKKHSELKTTLDELAKIKVSRRALVYSIITLVVLVVLTEVFLEPIIDNYSNNEYLSIASKVFIAFLLKPIDSFYERVLIKRAYKQQI